MGNLGLVLLSNDAHFGFELAEVFIVAVSLVVILVHAHYVVLLGLIVRHLYLVDALFVRVELKG